MRARVGSAISERPPAAASAPPVSIDASLWDGAGTDAVAPPDRPTGPEVATDPPCQAIGCARRSISTVSRQ
ncbi:hypothetical protein GCM10009819_16630 [Agromyces tropicus]|uniref:Uncharacterized protein n=1 Tax=Agromyces tropicus TaxID=555371 RepID=A0ABN2UBH7_9MICO